MQCQDAIPCGVISALLPGCAIDCAPPKPPPKKPVGCQGPQCFTLPPPGFPPPLPGQGGFFISTCPPCADGSIPDPSTGCNCVGIVTGCGDSCGSNYCSTRYQACIGDCIQNGNPRCDANLSQNPFATACHAQVCGNAPCKTAGTSIDCQSCCMGVIKNCVAGGGHPCGGGQPIIIEIPPGPERCDPTISHDPPCTGQEQQFCTGTTCCCFPAQPVLTIPGGGPQGGPGATGPGGGSVPIGVTPAFLPESDWLAYLQAFPAAFTARGYDAN